MNLLETLNINWMAIIANIIGLLALLYVLNTVLFKPVAKAMQARQNEIDSQFDAADREKAEMEALRSDYASRLAGIEAESREKIQSAIRDAQTSRDQIVSDAQLRARELVVRAEQEADRERQQAMITYRQQVVDIALGAATRIIGENMNDERQHRLVEEFINANPVPMAQTSGAAA